MTAIQRLAEAPQAVAAEPIEPGAHARKPRGNVDMVYSAEQRERSLFRHAMPFLLFLFFLNIALYKPSREHGILLPSDDYSNIYYRLIFIFIYICSLLVVMFNLGAAGRIIKRSSWYMLLVVLIMSSSLWSDFPSEVLKKSLHFVGIYFVILSYLVYAKDNPSTAIKPIASIYMLFISIHLASVYIAPRFAIENTGRWMGLTSHPNTLGAAMLVATWAFCSFITYRYKSFPAYIVAIPGIICSFILLKGTNSITSLAISTAVLATLPIAMTFRNILFKKTVIFGLLFVLLIAVAFLNSQSALSFTKWAFTHMGRDINLTGRTELWQTALKAFKAKPMFGWGFDDLLSLGKHYFIAYRQFHNGYLDLLVRGGSVAMGIVTMIIVHTASNILKIAKTDAKTACILFSLLLAIILHNLTEASFARGQHIIFFMFMFVYLTSISLSSKRPSLETEDENDQDAQRQ